MEWLSLIASILALAISTIVAIKSWSKSRVIYSLEEFVLRRINVTRDDANDRGFTAINEKLKTGRYVIESIQERKDGDWAILIACIKK